MAVQLRRDAWKDDRQFDDVRSITFEIDRLAAAISRQGISGAMVAGAVTVLNTSVTAKSRVLATRQPGGTNPGAHYVSAINVGVSFIITSTNAADTGQSAYQLFESP